MRPSGDARRAVLRLYSPHAKQLEVHQSPKRFKIIRFGRQSGKTTYAANRLLDAAWRVPGVYWYVGPTYHQARVVFRRVLRALAHLPRQVVDFNKSELSITFLETGSMIACMSGKEYNNLRVETLDGCVIDELREQHPELWEMVIQPMLATTGGWCDFASTPNGFDALYDLEEASKWDEDWAAFVAPSTCNPLFTQKEADRLKRRMSELQYRQEILAEYVNLRQGKAYPSAGAHNEALSSPFVTDGFSLLSPHLSVVVGMDFNVNPMSWHLGQFRATQSYWFDEIHLNDTNTYEAAEELVLRLKKHGGWTPSNPIYPNLRANPMVRLCGDATGKSRNTKATETDYDIIGTALNRAGITYSNDTPSENPPVRTRVLTVNGSLRSMDGTVSLRFHPKNCPFLKIDFDRVGWKKGAENLLDQTTQVMINGELTTLTHASDGVGYPICVYAPVEVASVGIAMQVIHRRV